MTSEDDEAFGHDPFGLRDLYGRNRGSPATTFDDVRRRYQPLNEASLDSFWCSSNYPSVAAPVGESNCPTDVDMTQQRPIQPSPAASAASAFAASGAPFAKQAKKRSRSCPADMSPQGTERFENTLIQHTQSLQHEQDNNGVNNSPSVAAASGAPGDVAPSPLVALPASAIASVAASTAGVIDGACQRWFPLLSGQSGPAWARCAEMPRHRPIITMARWRHKVHLHGPLEQLVADCQASIADDPIQIVPPIGQQQLVYQTVAKLLEIIDAEAALGKGARVYVGACVDVRYRWHGTTREEFEAHRTSSAASGANTPAKRRKRLYRGHKLKYTKMFVLASADASVSILLEPLLISVAKCRCDGDAASGALHCENGPADGRGQSLGHNWLYVCIGDAVPVARRPSPFALS